MPIKALLVEDNPGDAGLVRAGLAEDPTAVVALIHVTRLSEALTALRLDAYDCVLLDLSLPDSQGLHTVQRVREAAPSTPIIVLTGLADDAMALSAVSQGVQDYLVKGEFDGAQLVRTMRYAIARSESATKAPQAPPASRATLIGVLGAKAGAGTTTLACHLALQIAALSRKRTLLADFNVTAGLVSFYLRCERPYTILDATDNTQRLDSHFWEALVTRADNGLEIIGAPAILTWRSVPSPDLFREVLSFVRQEYDTVVADLGHGYHGLVPAVFSDFDEIYLVTAPNLLALYRTRTLLDTLRSENKLTENVRLILNRVPKGPDLSAPDLEGVLKLKVEASFPECPDELRPFNLQGRPASKTSKYARPLQQLATKITGQELPQPRRSLFSLFR